MAPRPITTVRQAAEALGRAGALLAADDSNRTDERIRRLREELARLEARKSDQTHRREAALEGLTLKLYRFMERTGITNLGTGTLSIEERRQGKTEKLVGDNEIAAEIKRLAPDLYDEIVTVEYKINLNALKKHEELTGRMRTVIIPTVRTFVLKPASVRTSFRRPLQWVQSQLASDRADVA